MGAGSGSEDQTLGGGRSARDPQSACGTGVLNHERTVTAARS